jgi:iron complex outermembrane receptor protein
MPSVFPRSVLLSVAAGAIGLAAPHDAQAQTKADSVARRDSLARTLAPFAVRATRSSQSTFTAPLAITHIDKSQFAGKSGFGLNDALGNVPGVLVQSRYGTSDVRIAIRGFGARGAGDRSNAGTSRGVRVLLDGMPETEPDGRTSFDNIDLAAAEGIDVIRSNASALWGNAAGGVISVSTVPVIDRPFATMQYQSGSYGLQRYIAQTGTPIGTKGGVAYATFVNTNFDGWRANSDARRVLVNTGIVAPVGDKTQMRIHLLGANNLFHVPGPLSADQVASNPRQANATYNSRDERRFNRLARLGASVEHALDDQSSVSAMAYVNPKYLQRSERGTFRDFTRYHGGMNAAYNRQDVVSPTSTNRFTAGIDQAYQDGAVLFYSLSATNGRGTTLRDNRKEGAYNSGIFVEDELTLNDKLGITLGLRGDAISYYYKNYINPKTDASRTFSQLTPKVGASWRVSKTQTVYANVGGGVEAPAGNETDPASTFGQDTVTALNPLLEPIRSYTYEVGTKQIFMVGDGSGVVTSMSYDAAAYLTNVRNELVPYRGGRFYFMAGRARRTGAEIAVTALAKGDLRFESSLTLSRNRYTDYVIDSVHYGKPGATADYSGNRIVGIPDWFYGANASWAPSKAPLGLAAQFGVQGTGGYWADDANAVRVTEAHIVSASLRADRLVRVGDATVKGFLTVENLADRRFIGSAFLNPDIVNGTALAFEPGMPRTIMLSFSVSRGR